jgi:rare lipoprotein A
MVQATFGHPRTLGRGGRGPSVRGVTGKIAMRKRPNGKLVRPLAPRLVAPRLVALMSGVAALTAACSQTGNPPPRSTISDNSVRRPTLARPAFTEDAFGVSTSPRLAGAGSVRKGGGTFKLGSPYKVAGRWYVPNEDPGYNRTGIGSWYGDDFHGRKTANGEIFDMNALTAAHPTLPLPSYAYVTNLDTNRTILVRVNDRGPYVNDRLIDLSHASARALGYEGRGMAHVRVRYAGRAPLNGDDRRERQFLAEQRWNSGRDNQAVAAYRPPQAPVAPPQPFPEGTPGRWSPTAYRAALAGKPIPLTAQPSNRPVWAADASPPPAARFQPTSYQPASQPSRLPPSALAGPVQTSALAGPVQRPVAGYAPRGPVTNRAYVQVGVFRERSNAERLRRELATLGPIEVAPVSAAQGEVYRVRLGPMSPSEANAAASQVASRGVTGSAVVLE